MAMTWDDVPDKMTLGDKRTVPRSCDRGGSLVKYSWAHAADNRSAWCRKRDRYTAPTTACRCRRDPPAIGIGGGQQGSTPPACPPAGQGPPPSVTQRRSPWRSGPSDGSANPTGFGRTEPGRRDGAEQATRNRAVSSHRPPWEPRSSDRSHDGRCKSTKANARRSTRRGWSYLPRSRPGHQLS